MPVPLVRYLNDIMVNKYQISYETNRTKQTCKGTIVDETASDKFTLKLKLHDYFHFAFC